MKSTWPNCSPRTSAGTRRRKPCACGYPISRSPGPEVDLAASREYGEGGLLGALTDAEGALDKANQARAVVDLRKQAMAEVPMRLARDAARSAIERSFAMPLKAAGIGDAKVVARFAAEEGTRRPLVYRQVALI